MSKGREIYIEPDNPCLYGNKVVVSEKWKVRAIEAGYARAEDFKPIEASPINWDSLVFKGF